MARKSPANLAITKSDIVALHEVLVRQHGGKAGISHVGSIDRAISLANHVRGSRRTKATRQAAALAYALTRSQAFPEDNGITGFMAAELLLRRNGKQLDLSAVEPWIRGVASGSIKETSLASQIKKNLSPIARIAPRRTELSLLAEPRRAINISMGPMATQCIHRASSTGQRCNHWVKNGDLCPDHR